MHHPWEVIEAALAHAVRNRVEVAYARSDLFERRRILMDEWAAYPRAIKLCIRPFGCAPVSFVATCAFPTPDSRNQEKPPLSTLAMFSVCWATTSPPYTHSITSPLEVVHPEVALEQARGP